MIKPRKAIKNFAPYVAGRPIEEIKRIYKLKKVVKLASNENPYLPPENVIKKIKNLAGAVNRYPDSNASRVKKAIAERLEVGEKNIVVGSGADEIIELLAKAYLESEDRIVVSRHSFIRYEMAARLMGAKTKIVRMRNFKHNLKAMAEVAGKKDKFLFVANPSNPTGTYNTKAEVEKMLEILEEKKLRTIPVFDEAYIDFARADDYASAMEFFRKGKNIIIMRTFSKIYGMAGLRVGFAVASEKICETLERIRPPFNTTLISQAAAMAAVNETNYAKKTAEKILSAKKLLEKNLRKAGFEFVPSQTNFLLVKVGNGKKVFKKLLEMGVIVRAMDEYELPKYIRVTVGKPSENKFFIDCLKKVRRAK
ncbi:MAG: histidinol-phosphate transaminase [Elusimicrobia bacterium]|nr:histidinol-phosphate transaminase [Elusimicrobiota bacterium]